MNLQNLLDEGRAIQSSLTKSIHKNTTKNKDKKYDRFVKLMEQGKISRAMKCIGSQRSGVLDVTEEVLNQLKELHPDPQEIQDGTLYEGPLERKQVEEVLYEAIDAEAIFKAAKQTDGAAGPSGADSDMWQRILCSKQFKNKPVNLCAKVARTARKLNTQKINPDYLRAYVAGRLLLLEKRGEDGKIGCRPIGIGEVIRRIIGRSTVTIFKPDIIERTAPLQTCSGIDGGVEASVHAMRRIWEDPNTEGILIIDMRNAFNVMTRKVALRNLDHICPELAVYLRNIYGGEAELFVNNSDDILYSKEGTTQGGPESMAFYAVSMTSLLDESPSVCNQENHLKKVAFFQTMQLVVD